MRQYIGTTVLGVLGIILSAISVVRSAWVWGLIAAISLVGAVLAYPVRKSERTAFGVGDFSGSSFANIYTDADDFIQGTAREALFINIIHRSRNRAK